MQNSEKKAPDAALTVSEVAARLSISLPSVYGLMKRGELPYVQIGRVRRVLPECLGAFIARNTCGGGG